jgi:hypothetical protein
VAERLRKSPTLVLSFTNHAGALSRHTMRYAGDRKLGIVYVALNSPLGKHEDTYPTYGFPTFTVDANDAIAIYRVSLEAIFRARSGGGPTLIACSRMLDNASALEHMRNYLERKGSWSEALAHPAKQG